MDQITAQLEEIKTRFLSGNLVSPAQATVRKHVTFLVQRLEQTEKLAAQYLGLLQKYKYGKVREEVTRLFTVREIVTEALEVAEMVSDAPKEKTPKEERRLRD